MASISNEERPRRVASKLLRISKFSTRYTFFTYLILKWTRNNHEKFLLPQSSIVPFFFIFLGIKIGYFSTTVGTYLFIDLRGNLEKQSLFSGIEGT